MEFKPIIDNGAGETLGTLLKQSLAGVPPSSLSQPLVLNSVGKDMNLDMGITINTQNPYTINYNQQNRNYKPDAGTGPLQKYVRVTVGVQAACLIEMWSGNNPLMCFGWSSYIYQLSNPRPEFLLEQIANEMAMTQYVVNTGFIRSNVRPYNYENRLVMVDRIFLTDEELQSIQFRLKQIYRSTPAHSKDDSYYKPGIILTATSNVYTAHVFESAGGSAPETGTPIAYLVGPPGTPGMTLFGSGTMDSYLDVKGL